MGWFEDQGADLGYRAQMAGTNPTIYDERGYPVGTRTGQPTSGTYGRVTYDASGNPVGAGAGQPTSGTYTGGAQAGQTGGWQPTQGGGTSQGGSGGYQPYSDDLFLQILHRYPPTYDGARQAQAEIERTFGPGVVQLMDHPTKLDKFILPGGRVADMMFSAGGPNARWADSINLEGPGGGAAGGLGGMLGSGNVATDPSFQFRLQEGQKALERSAAAKGTLLTGGTAKALTRYAQDYASGEYQNIFNRLFSTTQLGLQAAGGAAGVGSTYSNNVGANNANYGANQGNLITGQANSQAAGQVGSSNAWGNVVGDLANLGGQWWERRNARANGDYDYSVPYPNSPMGGRN